MAAVLILLSLFNVKLNVIQPFYIGEANVKVNELTLNEAFGWLLKK